MTPCRALVQAWLKAIHILLDIETWYTIKIKKKQEESFKTHLLHSID
jgi:hypothetical protein